MVLLRWLRRLVKAILWIVVLVLLIPVAGLAYGFLTTSAGAGGEPASGSANAAIAERLRRDIPGYQRPEELTFLTYPEWAIVYAAREYADFVGRERPSGFPYWAYIGRYWQDYATVIRASSAYPFNFANHQMLVVIGTSHTIEHALQWAYENTVGRLTEWTSGRPVAADHFLAGVALDYARFLDQVPWYEFPYADNRRDLMALQPQSGDDPLRMAERRYAFGFAYRVKQGYADLIRSALAATSDPALLDIHVWARGPVAEAVRGEPDTRIEADLGADGAVFVTKRYQVFTDMVPRLVQRGLSFVEIGGNDEILVTVLSPGPVAVPAGSSELFAYPLPAEPEKRRTGLIIPVGQLHAAVPALLADGATLEHIYDY